MIRACDSEHAIAVVWFLILCTSLKLSSVWLQAYHMIFCIFTHLFFFSHTTATGYRLTGETSLGMDWAYWQFSSILLSLQEDGGKGFSIACLIFAGANALPHLPRISRPYLPYKPPSCKRLYFLWISAYPPTCLLSNPHFSHLPSTIHLQQLSVPLSSTAFCAFRCPPSCVCHPVWLCADSMHLNEAKFSGTEPFF